MERTYVRTSGITAKLLNDAFLLGWADIGRMNRLVEGVIPDPAGSFGSRGERSAQSGGYRESGRGRGGEEKER